MINLRQCLKEMRSVEISKLFQRSKRTCVSASKPSQRTTPVIEPFCSSISQAVISTAAVENNRINAQRTENPLKCSTSSAPAIEPTRVTVNDKSALSLGFSDF